MRKIIVNVVYFDRSYYKLVFMRYYFKGALEYRIYLKYYDSVKLGYVIFYLRIYISIMLKMVFVVFGKEELLRRVV